ncbi:MAG: FAD-dependent oxidoreductase [Pseudomonadales bacterium]
MSRVVIVGAGPAGASLAYLLSNRGIDTTLIERRRDFTREFRGEVLMPSGIEALEQIGLASVLAGVPSQEQQDLNLYMNGKLTLSETLDPSTFQNRLPLAVSQAALLEAIVEVSAQSPSFKFERGVAVKELVLDGETVSGVLIRDDDGERVLQADLVIGADGRNSVVRKQMGVSNKHMNPPMDIVWCKLPCPENWQGVQAYAGRGHLLMAYHTWDDSLQLGWVILKDTFGDFRSQGIAAWLEEMANHVSPELAAHLATHQDAVQKPFLLSAVSDCVECWSKPGVLLIGDAAHTMSPVAGQGINLALRDTIVAANHLIPELSRTEVDPVSLNKAQHAIEEERMQEVEYIQALQAQPPKLLLSRAWWGEPLRRLAGLALSNRRIRLMAAKRAAVFPFGVVAVQLRV